MEIFTTNLQPRIEVLAKPADFDDWTGLLALLRESFAYMEGRIDPLSSLHRLDASKLAVKAMEEELVLAYVDGALAGCLFAAPRGDALYLGKIAVRPGLQGRGLARRMLALAEASRSEEHTSELQSLMRISYAVFCLKTKKQITKKSD